MAIMFWFRKHHVYETIGLCVLSSKSLLVTDGLTHFFIHPTITQIPWQLFIQLDYKGLFIFYGMANRISVRLAV